MQRPTPFRTVLSGLGFLLLAACSPKFDWREVRGGGYGATFPAKPSTLTRTINLGGHSVAMTMTAAEIDAVTFAVGGAELPDAAQAAEAARTMRTALIANIHGTVKSEKSVPSSPTAVDVEALGTAPSGGSPPLLIGRFVAKGKRAYQVIVVGPERAVSREAAETFLNSFKADE